ncbi:unnamed protein product [Protopolystoma xenopodis]|uniref:Uncharacterized protein n=1 Tax=Protopolystoma xenopodis TaxID=117903 RepID=A0A3S5B2K4_9PLAT|nr:unnamed protein product [Protopolystoma xenopodis]
MDCEDLGTVDYMKWHKMLLRYCQPQRILNSVMNRHAFIFYINPTEYLKQEQVEKFVGISSSQTLGALQTKPGGCEAH